jgi:hypothetical protein
MTGRARRAVVAALLALAGSGCGQPESRSGTKTNWLRACAEDDDCGPSLQCLCGRCSVPCTTNDGCEADAICASDAAALLQCHGELATACLASCTTSAECEAGQLCHHGTCTDSLPPAACGTDTEALVCEDFEADLPTLVPVVTAGNTVAASAVPTPSGQRALEAIVTAAPSVAYLRADIPAQLGGTLFLRGWVRTPDTDAGYDLAPLGLWASSETEWALRLVVKDAMLEVWSYTTPLTDPVPVVPGAWHCLQATITVGEAPTGQVDLQLDGAPVGMATELDTLPDGGIDGLTMGTQWAGAPATIQVDRVYLGPSAVTCWD